MFILGTAIYILDGSNGNKIDSFECPHRLTSIIPVDTNADGYLEILALSENTLYCFRHSLQHPVEIYNPHPFPLAPFLATGDFNGDKFEDIVFCNEANQVCCLDSKTHVLHWSYQIKGDPVITSSAGDLNGDSSLKW